MSKVEYKYMDGKVVTIEAQINGVEDTRSIIANATNLHNAIWRSVEITTTCDGFTITSQHLNM
jgi:hypothetical protein